MLEVVGQRWSASILLAFARGAERFSDILAGVPGLSARMLTVRLRQLSAAQLVEREVIPTTPVSVRYRLTERGSDLLSAIEPISRSEEHTSELQSLMRSSYDVFCLKKKRMRKTCTIVYCRQTL